MAHFGKINPSITVTSWPKVTKVEPKNAPFYYIKRHKSANLTMCADLCTVQFFTILFAINIGNFWHIALLGAKWCCMRKFQKTIFLLHNNMVFAVFFIERTILEKKIDVMKIVPIWIEKKIVHKNFRTWCGWCGKLAALAALSAKIALICFISFLYTFIYNID